MLPYWRYIPRRVLRMFGIGIFELIIVVVMGGAILIGGGLVVAAAIKTLWPPK